MPKGSLRIVALTLMCSIVPISEATGQVVNGTVRVLDGTVLAGAVVTLMDSTGRVVSRNLSSERGEYRLRAPGPGTYALRIQRLGFAPLLRREVRLGPETAVELSLEMHRIGAVLDTVRVSAGRTCKVDADAGGASLIWEQARAGLQAVELNEGARTMQVRILEFDRQLSESGKVTSQKHTVYERPLKKPWRSIAPGTLHESGYVVVDDSGSAIYRAPGLDMLASDLFAADHCFAFERTAERIKITFVPIPQRTLSEISGQLTIDRARMTLEGLEYRYVNLPSERDAPSGGSMRFGQLPRGLSLITEWRVRMPLLERRIRSVRIGGTDIHVAGFTEQGGEVVIATEGRDTVWLQRPRTYRGRVRDATSNKPVAGARIIVEGTGKSSTTDAGGWYAIDDLLPGEYVFKVQTTALDSIHRSHESHVTLTVGDETEVTVPSVAVLLAQMCVWDEKEFRSTLVGAARASDGTVLPRDVHLRVEWTTNQLQETALGGRVQAIPHERVVAVQDDGTFHACGLPTNKELMVQLFSDTGGSSITRARIADSSRFARIDLVFERSTPSVTVRGIILEEDAAVPLGGAELQVDSGGPVLATDVVGQFIVTGLGRGMHKLHVRRLGYVALDTTVIVAHDMSGLRLSLKRAIHLDRIVTLASTLPPSFDEHRRTGLGSFIAPEEMRKMDSRRLADVVRGLRGLAMSEGSSGRAWVMGKRSSTSTAGTYMPTPEEERSGIRHVCYSQVYFDEQLMNPGKPTPPFDVSTIPATTVEAVEFYGGPSETPDKYARLGSACGVLVLWTRR